MQNAPDIQQLQSVVPPEEQVLSPESYVFVALMSVEEGPNKASFMQPFQHVVLSLEAIDTAHRPVPVA